MRIPFFSKWLDSIKHKEYMNGYNSGYRNANKELAVFVGGVADGRTTNVTSGIREINFPVLSSCSHPFVEDRLPDSRSLAPFKIAHYCRTRETKPVICNAVVFVSES